MKIAALSKPLARLALAVAALALSAGLASCASAPSSGSGSSAGGASDGTGPGAVAGRRHVMAQALMSLGLSDGQQAQIRGIMRDAHRQNQGVTDPAARRANFKAAFAKVDAVLTPDQRTRLHAKLDQLRRERDSGSSS